MKTVEELTADVEKLTESIKALENKNSELIAREKKAKAERDEAAAAHEEAAREAAEKSGDVEKIKASLEKKYNADIAKLTQANADASKRLETLLIDNTISEALAKNGVMPQYARAVTAMLRADAKMDNGEAMANGIPLSDHISTFFGGDEGKHFIAAPANSGTGATGSKPVVQSHGFTKENFNSRKAEWMMLQKTNPDEARTIANQIGRPDLAS